MIQRFLPWWADFPVQNLQCFKGIVDNPHFSELEVRFLGTVAILWVSCYYFMLATKRKTDFKKYYLHEAMILH
jgi:hypothetical protein